MPNDFLHLRLLEQMSQNNLRLFVALCFDHNAHAIAVAFVANSFRDALDLFVLNQIGDVLDQARLIHLMREVR